jgi:carbohydrate esterase-like sialic acid-specific acetylesterase
MFKMALTLAATTAILGQSAYADAHEEPKKGKPIKVFLFAGQSNMEGRADGNKLSEQDRARLEAAQRHVQLANNHEPIQPLCPVAPSDEIAEIYQRDLIFGPEIFFGIRLAEAWPDQQFLFIKLSAGGTSLYGCWNPDWTKEKAAVVGEENEPPLYDDFIAYTREVLSAYDEDAYELCAMLWVQGETDSDVKRHGPAPAETYGDNLQNLIRRVRTDIARDTLPFILLEVGRGQVVTGMTDTANRMQNVSLITQNRDPNAPDYLSRMPNGHYDHQGMKTIGNQFADTFLRIYASD